MSDSESAADLFGDEGRSRNNSPGYEKSPSPQLSHKSDDEEQDDEEQDDEEQDVGDLVRQSLPAFEVSLISTSLVMMLKKMKLK